MPPYGVTSSPTSMYSSILLALGLTVLGFAFLSFQHFLLRKTGLLAFMGATFVLFQGISGSLIVGAIGVLLWFGLPWIELLTRVRHLELPIDKPWRRRVPPQDDFPHLDSATSEIEELNEFQIVDDWGYEWRGTEHFFRLFYDPSSRTQAAVCMTRDDKVAQTYVKLVSRSQGGQVYTTWNYPFCASLKPSPDHRLHWDRSSESFAEIFANHAKFLRKEGIGEEAIAEQKPDEFLHRLKDDQRRLVDLNMALGVLKASGEGLCRYSWRGLIFLWTQLVKEIVRIH